MGRYRGNQLTIPNTWSIFASSACVKYFLRHTLYKTVSWTWIWWDIITRNIKMNIYSSARLKLPLAHMCATVRRSLRRSYVKTVQSTPTECTKFGKATSMSTALTPFWCSENCSRSSLRGQDVRCKPQSSAAEGEAALFYRSAIYAGGLLVAC